MKMSKFIKSTLILLVGGFLTKVLGMLIKIITTRIIGTETLGLYMRIMPTFNLFITLAQGGLPISVSKIVSENKKDNKKIVFSSIFISNSSCGNSSTINSFAIGKMVLTVLFSTKNLS